MSAPPTDLGITQSGVSNAIKRLEDQVGTRASRRTTRRVSLTDDGAAFFERCRQALAEIEEAELVLKGRNIKPSGTLRIDRAGIVWPDQAGAAVAPVPGGLSRCRLRITFTDRYIDLIEEGVDICVRFGDLQDLTLIARRLTTTPVQCRRHAELFRQVRPAEIAR